MIVVVSGCAKDFVKGLGSGSKLRRVGFANDNCAGGLESLDKERVLRRHEVLVYARAVCGPDTGSQRQVLDGEWETMECSRGRSSRQTRVRLARCTQSFFLADKCADCIDLRIDSPNLRQESLHDLGGRDSP